MIAAGCNSWRNWEDIDCGVSDFISCVLVCSLALSARVTAAVVAEPHADHRALGERWEVYGAVGRARTLA